MRLQSLGRACKHRDIAYTSSCCDTDCAKANSCYEVAKCARTTQSCRGRSLGCAYKHRDITYTGSCCDTTRA